MMNRDNRHSPSYGKRTLRDRRIWITGASSGIGRALAVELAGKGARLVLSGRDEARLREVAETCGGAECIAFDVTSRDGHQRAAERIRDRMGALDILVLNAGTCEYVDLPEFDAERFRRVMDINFMGLVYGIEAALPLLREGTAPYIVGMSSTVAYTGLPRAEAYGASKAAIRYLMQSLRVDLLAEKMDVSIICPGFVETPLTDRNDFPMPMRISAEKAAVAIRRGMEQRRHEIRFPVLFSTLLRLLSAMPSAWRTRLLRPLSPAIAPSGKTTGKSGKTE